MEKVHCILCNAIPMRAWLIGALLLFVTSTLPVNSVFEQPTLSFSGSADSDGDGVSNTDDDCPTDTGNWTSNSTSDHDGDGCQDNSLQLEFYGLNQTSKTYKIGNLTYVYSYSNSSDCNGYGNLSQWAFKVFDTDGLCLNQMNTTNTAGQWPGAYIVSLFDKDGMLWAEGYCSNYQGYFLTQHLHCGGSWEKFLIMFNENFTNGPQLMYKFPTGNFEIYNGSVYAATSAPVNGNSNYTVSVHSNNSYNNQTIQVQNNGQNGGLERTKVIFHAHQNRTIQFVKVINATASGNNYIGGSILADISVNANGYAVSLVTDYSIQLYNHTTPPGSAHTTIMMYDHNDSIIWINWAGNQTSNAGFEATKISMCGEGGAVILGNSYTQAAGVEFGDIELNRGQFMPQYHIAHIDRRGVWTFTKSLSSEQSLSEPGYANLEVKCNSAKSILVAGNYVKRSHGNYDVGGFPIYNNLGHGGRQTDFFFMELKNNSWGSFLATNNSVISTINSLHFSNYLLSVTFNIRGYTTPMNLSFDFLNQNSTVIYNGSTFYGSVVFDYSYYDDDDDNDSVLDISDQCILGNINWTSNTSTDHDNDGCRDAGEDIDDDSDFIIDSLDNCSTGHKHWIPSPVNDYDDDGCHDQIEDSDDDNDGISDVNDSCPLGVKHNFSDYDNDGCEDTSEDYDDDNDGVLDPFDSCQLGNLSWQSSNLTDYDSDGCKDATEDIDDDNDNVQDSYDTCAKGDLNWTSYSLSDNDGDGCRDSTEDANDDNDSFNDTADSCPAGFTNWTSTSTLDYDNDGCYDSTEDGDDDNDSIFDASDSCPRGVLSWLSNSTLDYDTDGCKDSIEDDDDDNDGVLDVDDTCNLGQLGWTSTSSSDYDSDGCRDSTEDTDDDNDGVGDIADSCPKGNLNWVSNAASDYDSDGCRDSLEDADDDNDGISDILDSCSLGARNWTSSVNTDHDGDGCQDSSEDTDDDNDSQTDDDDSCPTGDSNWLSNSATDHDTDGCRDLTEDTDDDSDSVVDTLDSCPKGELSWTPNAANDYDDDGCKDATEDMDDDNDLISDEDDDCKTGLLNWESTSSTDHDSDGCKDNSSEDDDNDNDGVLNPNDECQNGVVGWVSNASTDANQNGCRDLDEEIDFDGDSVLDDSDLCPRGQENWTSTLLNDNDGDGCHDSNEDSDDDNDGILDEEDAFPLDSAAYQDTDEDGLPDTLLGNSTTGLVEDTDDDNDGIHDLLDPLPLISTAIDFDQDGLNDTVDLDDDNDGVLDNDDAFPLDASATNDTDGDGMPDTINGVSNSGLIEDTDDDNDGIDDLVDVLPLVSKFVDWDQDGILDHDDDDDDNDGVIDTLDAFPLDSSASSDYDGDGMPDLLNNSISSDLIEDLDDDNDGIMDIDDLFPFNSSESYDEDKDGVGDNSDQCPETVIGVVVDLYGCSTEIDSNQKNETTGLVCNFQEDMDCDYLPDTSDQDKDGDGILDELFDDDSNETSRKTSHKITIIKTKEGFEMEIEYKISTHPSYASLVSWVMSYDENGTERASPLRWDVSLDGTFKMGVPESYMNELENSLCAMPEGSPGYSNFDMYAYLNDSIFLNDDNIRPTAISCEWLNEPDYVDLNVVTSRIQSPDFIYTMHEDYEILRYTMTFETGHDVRNLSIKPIWEVNQSYVLSSTPKAMVVHDDVEDTSVIWYWWGQSYSSDFDLSSAEISSFESSADSTSNAFGFIGMAFIALLFVQVRKRRKLKKTMKKLAKEQIKSEKMAKKQAKQEKKTQKKKSQSQEKQETDLAEDTSGSTTDAVEATTPAGPRPSTGAQGILGEDGYEWITFPPNSQNHFYRIPGSQEWIEWSK